MKPTSLSRRVTYILVLLVICLNFISFAAQFLAFLLDQSENEYLNRFIALFNVDASSNIPAFYDSFALLLSAGLLALIAVSIKAQGKAFAARWGILALVLFYMGLDKAFGIHGEWLAEIGKPLMGDNYCYAKSVGIVAGVIIFGLSYWKFFLHLSPKFRLFFAGAALVYLGGGLGMEILQGFYSLYFDGGFGLTILSAIENSLEMLGIAFLIYVLFSYLETQPAGLYPPFRTPLRNKPGHSNFALSLQRLRHR